MSKRDTTTFRQRLVAAAPPRPKAWTTDERYEVPEPQMSEEDLGLLEWKSRRDHARMYSPPSRIGLIKLFEDEPKWVQEKIKAAREAEKRQLIHERKHSEWLADKSAWLDAKWRCFWADTVIREESTQ